MSNIITLTPNQQSAVAAYINMYRAKNQAPPLTYNPTITVFSQQWSSYLLSNNLFQHSGTQLYGENLAYFEGYGTDPVALIKLAIDAWYNEISLYNFNSPGFSEATGHFTCLVWLASRDFGIAIAFDPVTTKAVITMNTSPPGNVIGEFQQNVLPLVTLPPSPVPVPVPVPVPSPTPVPVPSPTPVPVPSPTPVPVPVPAPSPTPVPSASAQHVQQIIGMLQNFICSLSMRHTKGYLIYQLQMIIGQLATLTDVPVSNNMISMVNMLIHAVQSNTPILSLAMSAQNIIIALHPYATQ